MVMKGFTTSFVYLSFVYLSFVFPAIASSLLPRAGPPMFYLVSSSNTDAANLLPLRVNPSGGDATLTGIYPPAKLYFGLNGRITAFVPGSKIGNPILFSAQNFGICTTWGRLTFTVSSSDKCAQVLPFDLQLNQADNKLGSHLVINNKQGGFFACGSALDIVYKVDDTGPVDMTCVPINLDTVPVS